MDTVILIVLEGVLTKTPEFERTAYSSEIDALQAVTWWKSHGVKVLDLVKLTIDNGQLHSESLWYNQL